MNKHDIRTAVTSVSMLNKTCSCILQLKDGFLCSLYETYAFFCAALWGGFTGRASYEQTVNQFDSDK